MELVEARVPFDSRLHPRDRRGRWRDVAHYLRSLGVAGLHTVGGAVRDEALGRTPKDHDFIAIGHDNDSLHDALDKHGNAEDLVVAGRRVGVRFWPDDPDARALAPSGIEITPPRTEVSTGPGHKDFEIVADKTVPFAEDAKRRDFTINAMARSLDTGDLLDPTGGVQDAKDGLLRTTTPTSFRDDPLRIVRGIRFVSQLGVKPTPETVKQMREYAAGVEHVSGERVKEQLDKLLMGDHPADALRLARDTGVLPFMLPELAPTIGFEQQSKFHGLTADEHIFQVVQSAADAGAPLELRLAALMHDSGKAESAWLGADGKLHYYENAALGKRAHEDIGAEKARSLRDRLGYSNEVMNPAIKVVQHHMFQDHNASSPRRVRRFLAKHGPDIAALLIALKRADIGGKESDSDERIKDEVARLDAFEQAIRDEIASGNAFTLKQLKVNGDDLAKVGVPESPLMGAVLDHLLGEVISDPKKNDPDWLRAEARRVLKEGVPTREDAPSGTLANRLVYEETVADGMSSGGEPDAATALADRERSLLGWIVQMDAFRRGGHKDAQAKGTRLMGGPFSIERLVRDHGRVFTKMGPTKSDYDPEYTEPKMCFKNALHVAIMENPADDLTYVEGMAYPPTVMPVHHAWLVDSKGFVHDPTWDYKEGTVYAGVPFKQSFAMKAVMGAGTYGVLDKIPTDEPFPVDEIVDYPLEPTVAQRIVDLGIAEPDLSGVFGWSSEEKKIGEGSVDGAGDRVGGGAVRGSGVVVPDREQEAEALDEGDGGDDQAVPVGGGLRDGVRAVLARESAVLDVGRGEGGGEADGGAAEPGAVSAPNDQAGVEARSRGKGLSEAYEEGLHPRDRVGRWRRTVESFASTAGLRLRVSGGAAHRIEGRDVIVPGFAHEHDFFSALHEIGHWHHTKPRTLPSGELDASETASLLVDPAARELQREVAAWEWALANAGQEPGGATRRLIVKSLDGYIEKAERVLPQKSPHVQASIREGIAPARALQEKLRGDGLRESYVEDLHPRDRAGRWRRKLGGARLVLKPADGPERSMSGVTYRVGAKKLTNPQVRARVQRVADALVDFYGGKKVVAYHEPEYLASRGGVAQFRDEGQVLPGLLYGDRVHEDIKDPEMGVGMFRVIAHEAAHSLSGTKPGPLPGFSQTVEEGGAEILSLWFWHHRGQEFDSRDATRHDGRWTDPGVDSLAHHVVYRAYVEEVLKRAASRVGWDREKIVDEVEAALRGGHYERLAFRDTTTTDVKPPDGVPDDAVGLVRWLLDA